MAGATDGAREEHENDMVVDLVLVGLVMHSDLVRGVKKPKKGLIKCSWTSKGTSCNPNLPLQCSGGLKCVRSGLSIGPFGSGKCVMR